MHTYNRINRRCIGSRPKLRGLLRGAPVIRGPWVVSKTQQNFPATFSLTGSNANRAKGWWINNKDYSTIPLIQIWYLCNLYFDQQLMGPE